MSVGNFQKLPDLPDGWIRSTLGDEFVWGSGGTPLRSKPHYYHGEIPWAVIGDLNDGIVTGTRESITEDGLRNSSAKWVEEGSVLVAMYGSIGKLGIAGRRMTTNQAIAFAKPGKNDNKFLFYYLLKERANLNGFGIGNTQKNISQTLIKSYPFPVPPLSEQQRIVVKIEELFSQLDAGVAALQQAKAQLQRYRQAVLKAAVTGDLTKEWREAHKDEIEPAPVLLERILKERRVKWEETQRVNGKDPSKVKFKEPRQPTTGDLPILPNGWTWVTVDQLADVGTGATPLRSKVEYFKDGKIPWVTSGAVNNLFVSEATEFITDVALKETNAKVFPKHTLLVAMYGEGKTRGKVSELLIEAATNQALAALIFDGEASLIRPYVKQFFLKNYDDIRRLSSGGVQPNLNLGIIRDMAVPIPPLTEQVEIVKTVDLHLSLVDAIGKTIDDSLIRANKLRQSILDRASKGRLTTPETASIHSSYGSKKATEEKVLKNDGRFTISSPVQMELFPNEQ